MQWHQLGKIKQSAPRSRQITTPTPHHSIFYRLNAPPDAQPTGSKHLRQNKSKDNNRNQKSTANWSENATAATDAHTYVCTQLHTHIGMYAYRWTDNPKNITTPASSTGRESVPIQLAQCRFPGLAISSAKV